MSRQHIPLLYFIVYPVYLAVFNWQSSPPIALIFVIAALCGVVQLVRPGSMFGKFLFGLATLFSLFYASSIIKVMLETRRFMPFSTDDTLLFLKYCAMAILNFLVLLYWYRNGFHVHRRQKTA